MDHWKQVIAEGNTAFSAANYMASVSLYRQAAECATQQISQWFDTQAALTALVVSKLNLAEAQCRLERFEDAIETYAELSAELRLFQGRFPPSNPIVGHAAQALTRVKQEFLTLTKTYAYDIIEMTHQKQAQVQAINAP